MLSKMNGGGILEVKDYLISVMKAQSKGLYLLELPTGNGKTYSAAQAMREYARVLPKGKKIIYITTQLKNLPDKELELAYQDKKLFETEVLRIKSNFDEVVDKILTLEIPDIFKTDVYKHLVKNIKLYLAATNAKFRDKEYIKNLSERIQEGERSYRHYITQQLNKEFQSKDAKLKAIRENKKYKWIGELYPAVFTDDHKILLMSVSKFMKRNSVLVEQSYEFLKSDLVNDAIILVDEFDATKETIQDEIIDATLRLRSEYIKLFMQIYLYLRPGDFSKTVREALEHSKTSDGISVFSSLMNEAKDIVTTNHLNLSIKTIEGIKSKKQIFLFKDGAFHTILNNGEKYIRTTVNESDNRIDIFAEDKEEFFKNSDKEKDIVLYSLLREISNFLERFRIFIIDAAHHYMEEINKGRDAKSNEMNLENAVSTLLNKLELNKQQQELLMGEICPRTKASKDKLLQDTSFYQTGMEYYEFEDDDSHHDYTNINIVKVYDTPEKIILDLAKKATVIGISATSQIKTVVGNYDLDYLRTNLKENYHITPDELLEKNRIMLEKRWVPYYDGRINVNVEIIQSEFSSFDMQDYLKEFCDGDVARCIENIIKNKTDDDYAMIRYCNIAKAMFFFNSHDDIKSMLYLGMALAKTNNSVMDKDLLMSLFEFSCEAISSNNHSTLQFLDGDNFEEEKTEIVKKLESGEKVFVMSAYQTIGAGQNLQYKIPKNQEVVYLGEFTEEDSRYLYKDFDAIYLGRITNKTVNTYMDDRVSSNDLLKMLFHIEELYENNEFCFSQKEDMLRLAFQKYRGTEEWRLNQLYKTRSVIVQSSRMTLQAVGRMCRTFAKSPNVYILIEDDLLDELDRGEINQRIIVPEMKKIMTLKPALQRQYLPKEIAIRNQAEKISSNGQWTIRRLLAKEWTVASMKIWELLRTLTLMYPTASEAEHDDNEHIQKLYITSGIKQNHYMYSQYSDFNDVTVDFGNDKIAFKNSSRVKLMGDSEEHAIYEFSEKESGLPIILKYPGMRQYFIDNNYATSFKVNDYLMSPILFHNIYKGALGEVAGKFILSKELGIELKPITDPQKFEFFDFEMKLDVYVDFKNWKFTYAQDKEGIMENIINKMETIGAKRVYIINVMSNKHYRPSTTTDKRIVEIPMLIDEQGSVNYECLNMIYKEDFENVN